MFTFQTVSHLLFVRTLFSRAVSLVLAAGARILPQTWANEEIKGSRKPTCGISLVASLIQDTRDLNNKSYMRSVFYAAEMLDARLGRRKGIGIY